MASLTSWNKKDIKTIIDSEQFDVDYYLSSYPDVKNAGINPIIHYVVYGCKEHKQPNDTFNTDIYLNLFGSVIQPEENPFAHYIRNNENIYFFEKGLLQEYSHEFLTKCLNRFKGYALFDPDYYQDSNKKVSFTGISATRHALLYGIGEGREVLSPRRIAQYLGNECKKELFYKPTKQKKAFSAPKSIGVFYHSDGNSFIQELAELLHAYLTDSGFTATLMTEQTPLSQKPDLCIFCAPHEFFFLAGTEEWRQENIIEQSIMFNTEQPQTLWFTRGLIYILMSAGVMDLCHQNLQAFTDIGLNTFHFDPLVKIEKTRLKQADKNHPFFRVLPEAAQSGSSPLKNFSNRSIDISFFGNTSLKREKFFSRNAGFLSDYECFLYYRKIDGPLPSSGAYDILSRLPRYVAENSKILLNIHRDDNCFFEWHRIVRQGMAAGAVVITEECFPHPLYKDGEHYLTESPRHMPNLIEWLFHTEDGVQEAARIQRNCFTILTNKTLLKAKHLDLQNYISSVWSTVQ
ncbi:hypothetical protein AA0313_1634 [Acetobacter indonesiensis NRIC 0313]|uniref:Uncharacterized protein n=1 Tax=Acetobacter indonesiensis TaxID=104101 RepID=A0A6N3T6U7_9PROT|nr:hypothetical protein [Acetobacter indonesiensis]GAN61802.1 hypothetical protein Abin_002_058 [Acetobacter indonesiensis]GBQ57948.1 hypothetical protein AA0313_1634 [Acetobacter indonesiensis NRIC 0313]GEN03654.1 hypothetical protein AIN02nite_16790 [Acetobacter indonesiensis]